MKDRQGSSPRVDIIMTAYNAELYIRDQIESILKQSYANWKLIITDDKSTDNTYSIAHTYAQRYPKKIQVTQNHKNLGLIGNFQKGLELAEAPYIAICDVDDYWEKEKLSEQVLYMESHADITLCHHDLNVVDEKLNSLGYTLHSIISTPHCRKDGIEDNSLKLLLQCNYVGAPTVMFRRKLSRYILPMQPGILQDHWVALNAATTSRIGYIPKPLLKYRQRPGNMQGASTRGTKYYMKKLFEKEFATVYVNDLRAQKAAFERLTKIINDDNKKQTINSRISVINDILMTVSPTGMDKSPLHLLRKVLDPTDPSVRFIYAYFYAYQLIPKRLKK